MLKIPNRILVDEWTLANAVRKVEFKLLQMNGDLQDEFDEQARKAVDSEAGPVPRVRNILHRH
jgi:hypothetical protein